MSPRTRLYLTLPQSRETFAKEKYVKSFIKFDVTGIINVSNVVLKEKLKIILKRKLKENV